MKRFGVIIFLSLVLFANSCIQYSNEEREENNDSFLVSMPEPKSEIKQVELTEAQVSLTNALNKLGFNLLYSGYEGKGTVISPLSIYLALGMALNGSDGETAAQISNVLGGEATDINSFCSSIINQLPAIDLKTKLRVSNAIIVNNNYTITASYKDLIERLYYAPVVKLPFNDVDFVVKTVNNWCNRATEGLIPSIINTVDNTTMAYILNALYFKSNWNIPINHQQSFLFNDGKRINFLCGIGDIMSKSFEGFDVIAKDYGDNGKFKFYIILPKQKDGIKDLMATLKKTNWDSIAKDLTTKNISYAFPSFKLESGQSLKNDLKALGINDAFSMKADFSKMFNKDWSFISDVIHKAVVEVDKNGTEVAAVTSISMDSSSILNEYSFDFFANHPFIFAIADSSSNSILFTGVFDGN